jgi:iron complex outermembrane receptor protein
LNWRRSGRRRPDRQSQEFQLNYEGDRFTLVSGVYYLKENIVSHQAYADAYVIGSWASPASRAVDDDLEITSCLGTSMALRLIDRLSTSGGLRYGRNQGHFRTTSTLFEPAFNGAAFNAEVTDDTSGMVSLDYRMSDKRFTAA